MTNNYNPEPVKILKYPLPLINGAFTLRLPLVIYNAAVKVQQNTPVLYVEAAADIQEIERPFRCAYTGEVVPKGHVLIGTAMLNNDTYVLHYFHDVRDIIVEAGKKG